VEQYREHLFDFVRLKKLTAASLRALLLQIFTEE
jgi:hypothetical protein